MFKCNAVEDERASCLCHTSAFARFNQQLDARFSRRAFLAGVTATAGALSFGQARAAVPEAPKAPIAFTNIRLFDGKSETTRTGQRVIVEGGKIAAVEPDNAPPPTGARVIDGGGRTLMPGLIDAHYHIIMATVPITALLTADVGYLNLLAAGEAERTLMRGFTSIRDMAGPSFSLKRAIDEGTVAGPRIWPSGAMISQTSGHGDYRFPYEIPAAPGAPLSRGDAIGGGAIADGPSELLKRTREQLMLGASQIKLAAGGGVSSNYDPIDVAQYTEAEFRAAVDAAENWGTYVAVHAYTPRAIQTAIRGGVRCIEHGQLMDEATAKIMAEQGVWASLQPFLDDEDVTPFPANSPNRAKQIQMTAGTDTAYGLAKKYKLKTAWGTDTLFDAKLATRQGAQLAKMIRWYTPGEVLHTATGVNAQLLAMSGPRNPYPAAIGVVEAGAYADLLLVEGDPTRDINLVADAAKNFRIIMKDGRLYKATLSAT
ncbi:metal-dependent hydrolase family protein [Caulobacter sp. Root1455]|uniref:metal-dependent hydrolase family protein n=1 Tax=Caulobacter sp. Root1455 TaxID=1736465 RepID=UPI0009ECBB52|nr:amidohydrolase family protein [Caulobacter sp. Root1455]